MRSILRIAFFFYFWLSFVSATDAKFDERELGQPAINPFDTEIHQRTLIHWVQQIIVSLDNELDKWYKNQVVPEFVSLGWMAKTGFLGYCAGSLVRVGKEKIIVTNAFCARMLLAHEADIGPAYSYFSYTGIDVPISSIVKHPNFTTWIHDGKTKHDIAVMRLKQSDSIEGLPDGFSLPNSSEPTTNTTGYIAQLIFSDIDKYVLDDTEARSLTEEACKPRIERSAHSGWEEGAWLCVRPKEDNDPDVGYPYYVEKGTNDQKTLYGVYSDEGKTKTGHISSVSLYTNVAHYVDWIESTLAGGPN